MNLQCHVCMYDNCAMATDLYLLVFFLDVVLTRLDSSRWRLSRLHLDIGFNLYSN